MWLFVPVKELNTVLTICYEVDRLCQGVTERHGIDLKFSSGSVNSRSLPKTKVKAVYFKQSPGFNSENTAKKLTDRIA